MRWLFSMVAFVASLMAGPLAGHDALAQSLRLAGTGGAMPMMQRVATAYAAAGGPQIEIISGIGSAGAIQAIADGAIDLAVSARELRAEEVALGLTEVPLARTPLVFVTSRTDPPSLSSADLAAIFSAVKPLWPDGTPASIILRNASYVDSQLVENGFPGMKEALAAARQRPEVPVAPTDEENVALAEQLPGSLVQAGLSQVITEKRNLRLVTLDGIEPTLANLENGTYPHEKRFYLVYAERTGAAARALLGFVLSEAGKGVLRGSGSLSVTK